MPEPPVTLSAEVAPAAIDGGVATAVMVCVASTVTVTSAEAAEYVASAALVAVTTHGPAVDDAVRVALLTVQLPDLIL